VNVDFPAPFGPNMANFNGVESSPEMFSVRLIP